MPFRTVIACSLLAALFSAGASTIPDELAPAVEPALESNDRLAHVIGWVDEHTVLVTAQIDSRGNFWERKVVRVDARSGETRDLVNPGSLLCASATEKVVGILVGSTASMFVGNSKDPKPELKLFDWNSNRGTLVAKNPAGQWNAHICRKTQPADIELPGIGFIQRDIRYLEARDGHVALERYGETKAVLIRNGNPVATLDAKPADIPPVPQYLAFRDAYVLNAATVAPKGATMMRHNEPAVTEYPLVMMTRTGSIRREHFGALLERHGLRGGGTAIPYARGTLIFVSDRPRDGGGIYLAQGGSLKRIWCTNSGNVHDRKCNPTGVAMSPDGCRLAFFAEGSDNLKAMPAFNPSLKIISLCK